MSGAVEVLPSTLYFPALLIAVSLLGSAVLIIGFFVRYWMTTQEKKDDAQDRAIESIRNDFVDLKATLPRDYALRDDYVREITGLHYKMDRVARDISSINKLLARFIGGSPKDESE